MEKGKFISFEGIDCCGKTTQIRKLEAYLNTRGINFISVKEPGSTALGTALRAITKYPEEAYHVLNNHFHYTKPGEFNVIHMYEKRTPEAEMLLFMASRADIFGHIIIDKLKQGISAISDRSGDATRAYQGGGWYNGDIEKINLINRLNGFVCKDVWPDKTFFLEITYDEMVNRKKNNKPDYMESLGREFFERTIEEYHVIARQNPDRVVVIDGNKSIDDIFNNDILPEARKIFNLSY